MNFNMFSDLALTLVIEIPETGLIKLAGDLKEVLQLSTGADEPDTQGSLDECMLTLNISFASGEGKVRKDVPNVPG